MPITHNLKHIYRDCAPCERNHMIPYRISEPTEVDLMFGHTEPRIVIEEKYFNQENEQEIRKIIEETGIKTVRMAPDPDSLADDEEVFGDGWVSKGFDRLLSSPGRPYMPPMKRKRRKR